MATLTAGISASATLLPVSAEVEIGFYTVDSEAIYVTGMSRGAEGRDFLRRSASVDRGIGGTTPASHLSGATLTQYYPDAAGGGGGSGVTVDNTVDAPFEASTLIVPGAQESGAGEATLPARVVESETDPGAIGAGNLWVRLDPAQSFPPMLYVRNAADDGWVDDDLSGWGLGLTYYTGADVAAALVGQPQGFQILKVNPADGATLARVEVQDGDVSVEAKGTATSRVHLVARRAGQVGGQVVLDDTFSVLERLDAAGDSVSSISLLDTAGGQIEVVSPSFQVTGEIVSETALYPTGVGEASIRTGSVDPSAGAGVAATTGSLFMRDDGGTTGELWLKTGAADTAWTQLALVP